MKRLYAIAPLALFAMITLSPAAIFAQPPAGGQGQGGQGGGRGMDPARFIDRRMEQLKTELKLTADQEKKIRVILEEVMKPPTQAASQSNTNNGAASRRDRLVADRNTTNNREQIDAKIKKVLTAEQAKKYDAMPRGGRGQFDPAQMIQRRLDSMERDLTLTADQKTKIKAILEKSSNNMRQMFQPQQNGQQQDRSAMMAAFQKAREQETKEIEAVLKPDQVKKYRAQQEEMQKRMQERMQNRQNNNN